MIEFMYTLSTALPVVFAALGAGIGQGLIGVKSLQAVNIQPYAAPEISRVSMIGMALTETSAILGGVVSILLVLDTSVPLNYEYASLGKIGIVFAIGLTSLIAGITSSLPAQAACLSVAKQPFFSNKILQLMLLTQSLTMTPNLFGFVIALFIQQKISTVSDLNSGLQLLAAGMVIGIGSIGPCIGLSRFAQAACSAVGVNRKCYGKIVPFTFACEAMIETPAIFSLLIAFLILSKNVIPNASSAIQGIAFIAAALCMSFSTIGTGVSAGKIGSAACKHIGNRPDSYSIISNIGFLALAMIDTFAIYGSIISLFLIYAI